MANYPFVTVGGLIVAPDGEVLLVQSDKWHRLYSLPGGKVDEGETLEEALCREIWEETGLKVLQPRFVKVQESIFSPEFWQSQHFVMHDFIAHLDPSSSKEHVQLNHEAVYFYWVSPEKALTLPLQQECRVLMEWYLSHRASSVGFLGVHQHRVDCIVGIYPEERLREQPLIVDLKMKMDFSRCLLSAKMQDSIDYVLLAELCTQLAREKRYLLLETFASDLLDECLNRFKALWAWVRVQKPQAIPTAAYAYIELERYLGEAVCGR